MREELLKFKITSSRHHNLKLDNKPETGEPVNAPSFGFYNTLIKVK